MAEGLTIISDEELMGVARGFGFQSRLAFILDPAGMFRLECNPLSGKYDTEDLLMQLKTLQISYRTGVPIPDVVAITKKNLERVGRPKQKNVS